MGRLIRDSNLHASVEKRLRKTPIALEVGLDAETQNGPLTLDVPDGYNAQLETGTINGPMDIGFPIMVQGRIGMGGRRRITTTLGIGGAMIRAVTTNGPAVIRKT